MQSKSDAQLLRDYAEQSVEAAFTEIVTRHANLVYSAAMRLMDSPDMAADITQSVFISLARGARTLSPRLAPDASLAGWLCRCARNISLNLRRDQFRQLSRERQAMEELPPISETTPDWERLGPVLDEAMAELSETDYDALVMRFYKNQDLRSVGRALGLTDDTAQKRISRALDKLREHLSRRGISTTAGALAIVLSANAVQAAPVGLVAAISAAAVLAGSTVQTSAAIAATKTIAMTTLQKTFITAALAVAAGAGIYEARQASTLRSELQTMQAPLAGRIRQLESVYQAATNQLAALRAENEKLKSNQNSAELLRLRGELTRLREAAAKSSAPQAGSSEELMKSWLEREDKLKESVEQNPGKKTPEFQLLSEQQWLDAAMNAKFDSDTNIQKNLADLRQRADNDFASLAQPALLKYLNANNGQFPTDLSQLQPYFSSPVDDDILNRWQIVPQSSLPTQKMGGDWLITEKAPVDPALDQSWAIGPNGYGNSSYQSPDINAAIATLAPALKAYEAANNGNQPADPSQILPFLTTPEQQAAYTTLMKNRNAKISPK